MFSTVPATTLSVAMWQPRQKARLAVSAALSLGVAPYFVSPTPLQRWSLFNCVLPVDEPCVTWQS